jgi:hypothetical protein
VGKLIEPVDDGGLEGDALAVVDVVGGEVECGGVGVVEGAEVGGEEIAGGARLSSEVMMRMGRGLRSGQAVVDRRFGGARVVWDWGASNRM